MFSEFYIVEITLHVVFFLISSFKSTFIAYFWLQIIQVNYRNRENEHNTEEVIACDNITWR